MPIQAPPWPVTFLDTSAHNGTDTWDYILHVDGFTYAITHAYVVMGSDRRRVLKYNTATLALVANVEIECSDIAYNVSDAHFYTISNVLMRKFNNDLAQVATYTPTEVAINGFKMYAVSSVGTGVYAIGNYESGAIGSGALLKVNTALSTDQWTVALPSLDSTFPAKRIWEGKDGFLWFGQFGVGGFNRLYRIDPSDGTIQVIVVPPTVLDRNEKFIHGLMWDGADRLLIHARSHDNDVLRQNVNQDTSVIITFTIPTQSFASSIENSTNDWRLQDYYGYTSQNKVWVDARLGEIGSSFFRRHRFTEIDVASAGQMRTYTDGFFTYPNPPGVAPHHDFFKDAMQADAATNTLWIGRHHDSSIVNDGILGIYVLTIEPEFDDPPTDPPPPDPDAPDPEDPCALPAVFSVQEPLLPPLPNLMDIGGLSQEIDIKQVTTELWTYLRDLNAAMFGSSSNDDTVSVFLSMFRRWAALSLTDTENPEMPPDPLPPIGLQAFSLGGLVLVQWTFSRDPSIKGYEIEHATASDFSNAKTIRVNTRQWIDIDIAPGVPKYYRVASLRDNNRMSVFSDAVTATGGDAGTIIISDTVAGDGLVGGGGAPLSVNPGPGIIIVNSAVQAHVDNEHIGLSNGQISVVNRRDLVGTTNQVLLSASGTGALLGENNVTLSLPQNIHTGANPTFNHMTLTDALLLGNTSETDNGHVRYTGTDFEGRVGDAWVSFTAGAAGGEANLGANVGTGDGVFKDKTSVTLNFKSLVAGTGISLTPTTDEIEIAATGGGSGASEFLDLMDTPSDYTGHAGKAVTVTSLEDELEFTAIEGLQGTAQTYNESNVTTDRTFDANSTTIDELADILGTLIADLRNRGVVN